MVVAFARASSIKVEIYWHKKKVRIICTILKLERVFSAPLLIAHTPNSLHSITYHENNVQSPIRIYLIIALHEHWAIFHVLELYSSNQIPFCQIRLRSNACHFLVNKLHLITYSYRIVQPHWKKLHMELKATDYDIFHIQFFRVLTFSTY